MVGRIPKREDIQPGQDEEEQESRSALWDAVISAQDGDVLVVDARANLETGCLGEMLMTGIHAKGVQGLVVDGCVRDMPQARSIGLPLFLRGATPHNAGHFAMYPWDYNVPIGCGGVLVMPGDLIVADDDGAVVVPIDLAPKLLENASAHAEWEDFSRMKLLEGGDLRKYYPLTDEAREEYEAWTKHQM